MKSLYIKILVFFSLIFNTGLGAQGVNPILANALENTLDSMRQELAINGLSGAIQLPNDSIWAAGSGVSTFTPVDSISADHTFATGSTAKMITAMCILQLVDEEVLSLDDQLYEWLPNYANIDSTITIRQLLRHQSGISDFLLNPIFQPTLQQDPSKIWTAEEALTQFSQPSAFPPGTGWGYSNANYVLLEMIIEEATGVSFEKELERRFFDPMDINSFANPAFDSIVEPYAHLWLDITGDGILDDAGGFITTWLSLFSVLGPAAGYFATPTDLAIWTKKSMSGSLVNPDTWTMATETVFTPLPNGIRYGLGIMESQYLGYQAYGHGGDLSYATQALYFPELEISIVVSANDVRANSWNLIPTMRALLQAYLDYLETITSVTNYNTSINNTTIYPNPFVNELNIKFQSSNSIPEAEIVIYDLQGKIVRKSKIDIKRGINDINFNVSDELPSNLYFLQIKSSRAVMEQILLLKK